jgi:hypothetical protein
LDFQRRIAGDEINVLREVRIDPRGLKQIAGFVACYLVRARNSLIEVAADSATGRAR